MSDVAELILRLWKATPERARLDFERHPVGEVRNLEAENARLRKENEQLRRAFESDAEAIEQAAENARLREDVERATESEVNMYAKLREAQSEHDFLHEENVKLREEIARYKADPTLLLNVDESRVMYFPEETTG